MAEVTDWNRDHARQQLRVRLAQAPGRASAAVAVIDKRRAKPCKYSYEARKVFQSVWATSGGLCGKYLASSMSSWLERVEAEGSLVQGRDRYRTEVRAKLESM